MIDQFIDDPVKTEFRKLYKYTQKGQAQEWQIIQDGNTFYTIEGIVGGKLTTSLPTVCKGKNLGKKNETTDAQQAYLEAAAKWQKKKDAHYNEVITVDRKFFEPMLAKEFEKGKIDYKKQRVFVQPKLDGLRGTNANNSILSRNGKPYLSVPHLYQDSVQLDGELYNHEFKDDFNKIVSLCKKQKPTPEELEESRQNVMFYVYDFPEYADKDFSERYELLQSWLSYSQANEGGYFILVETYEVFSDEDVDKYNEDFILRGYEGTMVRLNTPYENKRSKNLLKYKTFKDDEFVIKDVVEGEGGRTGTVGYFIMDLGDGTGRTFKSNIKGDFDYLKTLLADKDQLISKTATVKYFNRTPDNIPRFPYVIKIDRESYE